MTERFGSGAAKAVLERAGLTEIAEDYPAALYRCPAGRDIGGQGEEL